MPSTLPFGQLLAMRLSSVVCLAALGWLAGLPVASANTPARLDDPYTNESEP
jgi:hypothetical protein